MYNVYDNIDGRQIKYYKLGNYAQQRKETMDQNTETMEQAKLTDEQLAKLLAERPVFISTDEGDEEGTEKVVEATDAEPSNVN